MFYLSTTRVKIELPRSHNDPREFVELSTVTEKTSNFTEIETTTSIDAEELHHDIEYDDDDESIQAINGTNPKSITNWNKRRNYNKTQCTGNSTNGI